MQKRSRIVVVIAVLLLSVAGLWWWKMQQVPNQPSTLSQRADSPTPTDTVSPLPKQTSYVLVASASATNALELAQSQLDLQLKQYDFGIMVEGVAGLVADTTNYWAMYLNGVYAQVGIADLLLEPGDRLELRYETISL